MYRLNNYYLNNYHYTHIIRFKKGYLKRRVYKIGTCRRCLLYFWTFMGSATGYDEISNRQSADFRKVVLEK
jgi:hypothetical protein